jgi:histidinol phosphatase-like enzyme
MNYDKLIVCDFDDTLATVKNYDFENARVNTVLITALNAEVEAGWSVHVYTARGHLSCNNREEADAKYRKPIEDLLQRAGLKYELLSFNKPYAKVYIDDKGITPEDFIERT